MFAPAGLPLLSQEEIRAFVVQRLRAAMPEIEFLLRKEEPHRLTLSHPEAGDLVLNLGNLVQELRMVPPSSAEQLLDTFVSLAQRALKPPEIRLDRVYPGLRHRAFLDATDNDASDAMVGDGPGDLVTVVLADQGEGLATLNETAVEAAGFTPDDVLRAAEQNFVKLLPGSFEAQKREDGVLSLALRDYPWLGTSVLFVPLLISRVMEERGWSRALIAAPTRETVDLVDLDAPRAASVMENWMSHHLAGPRTQSETVFSFDAVQTEYRKSHLMIDGQLVRLN